MSDNRDVQAEQEKNKKIQLIKLYKMLKKRK
jgi:hypothetical protein